MTAAKNLLPKNATPWERLFSEVTDPFEDLDDQFSSIRDADINPPPQFLPFLVWEYGLGELTPYVPQLYQLIDEGIDWQRVRGTPAAIAKGLGWIGYGGTIEEEPVRRKRWNRFQLHLSRIRDNDAPDLLQIYGITSLSPPIRSKFVRGFRTYDIRTCETSYQKTSNSLTSDHSGVRVSGADAKWSFGRYYEADKTLTEAELRSLSAWVATVDEGGLWADANYLWFDRNVLWSLPGATARRLSISSALTSLSPVFIRFRDAAGDIIGNVRAVIHPVRPGPEATYTVAGVPYVVNATDPTAMIVQGMTDFGNGNGRVAATASVVFGGMPPIGLKPGTLWLEPKLGSTGSMTMATASLAANRTGMTGGVEVSPTAMSIPFGQTVREKVRFLLRF